jgi:chromosome segregation ATPase
MSFSSVAMEESAHPFDLAQLSGGEIQKRQTLHKFLNSLPEEILPPEKIPSSTTPSGLLIEYVKEVNHAIEKTLYSKQLATLTARNETLIERISRLEEELRNTSNFLQVKQLQHTQEKTLDDTQIETLTASKLRLENQLRISREQMQIAQQQLEQVGHQQTEEKIQLETEIKTLTGDKARLEFKIKRAEEDLKLTQQQLRQVQNKQDKEKNHLKTEVKTLKEKELELVNSIKTAQEEHQTTQKHLEQLKEEQAEEKIQFETEITHLKGEKANLKTQIKITENELLTSQHLLDKVRKKQDREKNQLETEIKNLTDDKLELEEKIETAHKQVQAAQQELEQMKRDQEIRETRLKTDIKNLAEEKIELEAQIRKVEVQFQATNTYLQKVKSQQAEEEKDLIRLQDAFKQAHHQLQLKQEELEKAKNDHRLETAELEKKISTLGDAHSITVQELTDLRKELQQIQKENQDALMLIISAHRQQTKEVEILKTQLSKFEDAMEVIKQEKEQGEGAEAKIKEQLLSEIYNVHRSPKNLIRAQLVQTQNKESYSDVETPISVVKDTPLPAVPPPQKLEKPQAEIPAKENILGLFKGYFYQLSYTNRVILCTGTTVGLIIGSALFLKFIPKSSSPITAPTEITSPKKS